MKALWFAIVILCVLDYWLLSMIGRLTRRVAQAEKNVRLSMAGKLLPPDTSDPGSRL